MIVIEFKRDFHYQRFYQVFDDCESEYADKFIDELNEDREFHFVERRNEDREEFYKKHSWNNNIDGHKTLSEFKQSLFGCGWTGSKSV